MDNFSSIVEAYNLFVSQSHIRFLGHIVGLAGMSCIVLAYYFIERGTLNRDNAKYYILNLSGAALLEVSLMINFNLGSFVIEIFWIAISIFGLLRLRKKSNEN